MLRHEREFAQFHMANPHIYEQLERYALQLRRGGVSRWGIKALWEVLRYELAVATNSSARSFRLNNNFTSHYARLLMNNCPELSGFFETRQHRGDHDYRISP
jgi:hypothetical protein